MYAPKMLAYSREERQALGLAHRIDTAADAALAEIKAMADKAREDLGLLEPAPKERTDFENLYAAVQQYLAPGYANYLEQHRALGMVNLYPQNAYAYDSLGLGAIIGGTGMALLRPLR